MHPNLLPQGVALRGRLPHRDLRCVAQSITFRLADTLPAVRLRSIEAALGGLSGPERDVARWEGIETWLDRGCGECWLAQPEIAAVVRDELTRFDQDRYQLHAWVIMPNHVHVLVTPSPGTRLAEMVRGWKGASARVANRILGRSGAFWAPDYFDRFIRSPAHFVNAVRYVFNNPDKAGLSHGRDGRDGGWSFRWVEPRFASVAGLKPGRPRAG